jgi:hypothetical protein
MLVSSRFREIEFTLITTSSPLLPFAPNPYRSHVCTHLRSGHMHPIEALGFSRTCLPDGIRATVPSGVLYTEGKYSLKRLLVISSPQLVMSRRLLRHLLLVSSKNLTSASLPYLNVQLRSSQNTGLSFPSTTFFLAQVLSASSIDPSADTFRLTTPRS